MKALTPPMNGRKRIPYVKLLIFIVFGIYYYVIAVGLPYPGVAIDEEYNLKAADAVRGWMHTLQGTPLSLGLRYLASDEAIDRYWDYQHYHGPMARYMYATGQALLCKAFNITPLLAARYVAAGALMVLLYIVALLAGHGGNTRAGWLAMVAVSGMPPVISQAYTAGYDLPLVMAETAAVYCFIRGTEHWAWSFAWAVCLTIVALTKLEGLLILIPLLIWAHLYRRHNYSSNTVTAFFLLPMLSLLAWPWLWHHRIKRASEILYNYSSGYHEVYYLGQVYDRPAAPWHYPFVTLLVTLPDPLLPLLGIALWDAFKRIRSHAIVGISLLVVSFYILLFAIPVIPKFDGPRLFLPIYPFLAVLIGVCLDTRLAALQAWTERSDPRRRRRVVYGAVAIGGVALMLVSTIMTLCARPFLLDYYNVSIGGQAGAARKGFQFNYVLDAATSHDVIAYLNTFPPGTSIALFPGRELDLESTPSLDVAQRYLGLSRKLRIIDFSRFYTDPSDTVATLLRRACPDVFILQVREYQFNHDPVSTRLWRQVVPDFELSTHGAPLVRVYRKQQYLPLLPREEKAQPTRVTL